MVKNESEEKLNMRSTRFCNIYKVERLGISLEKVQSARVHNLKTERRAANHTTHEEGAVFWREPVPQYCHPEL